MRKLIQKFPDGFDGFKDPDVIAQEPLKESNESVAGETLAISETDGEGNVHDSQE